MLKQLKIKNFRCLKETKIDLAPITLLYGVNGSGKSSILYSLFVFKNIIMNPNQTIDTFLISFLQILEVLTKSYIFIIRITNLNYK